MQGSLIEVGLRWFNLSTFIAGEPIISVAKKTNLKFEIALPELKRGLVQSISGLL